MTKLLIKVPYVLVQPTENGIQYIDKYIELDGEKRADKINQLFKTIDSAITEKSSILLYRQDIKRASDQLSGKSISSKEIFNLIKSRIRANYEVLKLTFDPRTLQFNGYKTAFIIHKRIRELD